MENVKLKIEEYMSLESSEHLEKLAHLLGLPIDLDRISDYHLEIMSLQEPKIRIVDTGINTSYTVTYESKGLDTFKLTTIISGIRTVRSEKTFQVSNGDLDNPKRVIRRSAIDDGNYELSFETIDNVFASDRYDFKSKISYDELINRGSKIEHLRLLTKEYRKIGDMDFEHIYSFGRGERRGIGRYCFFEKSGVSYGLDKRETGCYSGFALENCHNVGARNVLLLQNSRYSTTRISPVDEKGIKSVIHFRGFVGGIEHSIRIYKDTCGIHLLYTYNEDYDLNIRQPINDGYSLDLPAIAPGNISIEEVDSVMGVLMKGFGEPKFVGVVVLELAEFRKRICINRGLTPKDENILNPEFYVDLTDTQAEDTIMKNYGECFEKAKREFKKNASVSLEALEDIKSFRFRPRN